MKNKSLKAIAAEPFGTSHAVRSLQVPAVRALLALSLFLTCFLSASSAEAAPVIQLMTPQSGPVGTLVAIVGSGFGASQGTSTVTFNGTPVTWVSWSATSLQVQVPAGASSGNVVVTVSGKGSNTKSFTVTPPPVITGLSPASGPLGATIAITGSNFTAGGTQSPQVVFNPDLFASPISSTDTSITVAVPPGAATGDLLVSVGGGSSNAVLFTVTSSGPSISGLTPDAGVVGTAVTITGTNFGSSKGTSTVTFNGTTGIPTSWSATSINVPIPTGATTGSVLVTVGGVASNPYGFEVGVAAPNITSISPTSGAVATSVTIKGTGFGSTQGTNTVNFNGVSGVPTSWSATQIKVPVPTGATTGPVVVTASGTVSNGVSFTVPGTGPTVTSLSPSSGPVGSSVTITGTNFGATQGASTVTFNGVAVTATGWSPTSIVATVPSGATSGSVVVTVGGTASSGLSFTVAPSITSLSPTSGAGGVPVTITGTSFGSSQGTSTVTFNGTAATPTAWGPSSIIVPVPTGATTGNVVVSVSGVVSNGVSFAVLPAPSITSLSTSTGAVGTSVTITGTNFGATQGTSTVTFNGTAATPTSWGASSITVPVPTGATTGNVVVTVSGVVSNGVSFTVLPTPSIASLSPTSGAVGTSVTITGANFGATQGASTVTFGGTAGTPTSWSATSIAVTVPAGATTGNVVVTFSGVASNGVNFTVLPAPIITSLSSTSGAVGVPITITGTNFGATQGNSTVTFNGTTALVTLWSSTSIGVTVPSGATTGNVVVNLGGFPSNGVNFIVGTLASLSLTPQNPSAIAGNTLQFTATGTYLDNSTQNLTAAATWTSSAINVATINSSGMATVVGPGQTTIQATVGSLQGSTVLTVSGFTSTGSLGTGRYGQTATLLENGTVLVVGGYDINNNHLASAELYNLTTGAFTATGSLNTARANHTATLLDDGTVLIVGGFDANWNLLASAELYSPSTGTFAPTGSLATARANHTATLLANGKVLVAGSNDTNNNAVASAELYDPSIANFIATGSLNTPRGAHSATLLNDGTVLVLGGQASGNLITGAELYNPTAGTFSMTGSLNTARMAHTATLMNSGMVLVAGGQDINNNVLSSAELYNPGTMTFSVTGNLNTARGDHTATLLNNGQVLVEGGFGSTADMLASAELYDPVAGTFSPTSSLNVARQLQTATLLPNGLVLTAGGFNDSSNSLRALSSAELYQPPTFIPPNLVWIDVSPFNPSLPPGRAQSFTASGTFADNSTQTLASVTWSSSNNAVTTVSSDSTNHGVGFGVASGSATVSACTGPICGFANVTVPSSLVSITVNPATSTLPVGLTLQFFAVGTYADGSTQNISSLVSWSSTSPLISPIGTTGLASGLSLGTTTIAASLGSVSGSTSLAVVQQVVSLVVQPSLPGMLVGGTQQFTAMGTYSDGSTHDLTTSVSWSSYNPGVATISSSGLATGITSGNATIQASFGSVSSNNVPLTVAAAATPPSISAQIVPPPNANGWNDSNVTVTFICTPGSANILACPSPQTVTSEGTNQVFSWTVTDAAGGSASTSVTLNIEKTPPTLAVSSPADQSAVSSSSISVTGSLTSSLTPISGVTCNGATASFDSSSFTCSVTLNPGLNMLMVIANDVAGNAVGVRLHVTDSTALPAPTSLQITPVAPFVSVGSTQQFTAIDQLGHPRVDATWAVDNTSIATISTDSSPTLTGVAGGQVTLTASVGSVSAQAQVTVLAGGITLQPGSIVWSSSLLNGYQAAGVVPVVPSGGNSADVVSLDQSGTDGSTILRAFSSSGQQIWQTALPYSLGIYGTHMGDNSGGVLARTVTGYADIDGSTGSIAWMSDLISWSSGVYFRSPGAVGLDGAVYLFDASMDRPMSLERIDPDSGHAVPVAVLDPSNFVGGTSTPMVAPDGSIYVEYWEEPTYPGATVYLFRHAPDGSTSSQTLGTVDYAEYFSGSIIPDGQGGVLAAWITTGVGGWSYQVLDTTSGSVYSFFPQTARGYFFNLVIGGDGTAYLTDGATIWSFDPLSGQVNWTVQPPSGVDSMFAAQGGGLFVVDQQSDNLQIASDGATTVIGNQSGWENTVVSATGRYYAPYYGNSSGISGMAQIAVPATLDASSLWPEFWGGPEPQNAPAKLNVATFITRAPGYKPPPGTNAADMSTISNAEAILAKWLASAQTSSTFYDQGMRQASVSNFLVAIGQNNPTTSGINAPQYPIVAFIGDSDVIACAVDIVNLAKCVPYSDGLQFVDQTLIRTPNCDNDLNIAQSLCNYLDTVDYPVDGSNCWPKAYLGYLAANNGVCYRVAPPCSPNAHQIGNYCFYFPSPPPKIWVDSLTSKAKVVFIGACQTTSLFTGWWQAPLPGGGSQALGQDGTQALVVPDINAMANAPQNAGLPVPGQVDLTGALVGYQALLNAIAQGSYLGDAVTAANSAISKWYNPQNYTLINAPIAPMPIYKVFPPNNANICLRSCKP